MAGVGWFVQFGGQGRRARDRGLIEDEAAERGRDVLGRSADVSQASSPIRELGGHIGPADLSDFALDQPKGSVRRVPEVCQEDGGLRFDFRVIKGDDHLGERSLARSVWACDHETGERIDQSLEMSDRLVELGVVARVAIERFAGARASHLALGIRDAFEGIDRGPTCPRVASARHRHVATSATRYLRDDRA
jgi:hypothetical protein